MRSKPLSYVGLSPPQRPLCVMGRLCVVPLFSSSHRPPRAFYFFFDGDTQRKPLRRREYVGECPSAYENWSEQHGKQLRLIINSTILLAVAWIQLACAWKGARKDVWIRRQRYIETVMRDTGNACIQSCTKSFFFNRNSIRVQWPKAVDTQYKITTGV